MTPGTRMCFGAAAWFALGSADPVYICHDIRGSAEHQRCQRRRHRL